MFAGLAHPYPICTGLRPMILLSPSAEKDVAVIFLKSVQSVFILHLKNERFFGGEFQLLYFLFFTKHLIIKYITAIST
jgi:hypothetical protein